MAQPRYAQVDLNETPWYHVVSRCVRRAYLCGVDHVTGQSFEHRRDWLECRIQQLAAKKLWDRHIVLPSPLGRTVPRATAPRIAIARP